MPWDFLTEFNNCMILLSAETLSVTEEKPTQAMSCLCAEEVQHSKELPIPLVNAYFVENNSESITDASAMAIEEEKYTAWAA